MATPSSIGFAKSGGGMFAARLDANLGPIIEALRGLRSDNVQPAAEIALRQTLADILAGLHQDTATGFVVRVSLRDANSCEACLSLHGTVVRVGTEHYAGMKPPNHCEGGKRCRCEYVDVNRGRIGVTFGSAVTQSTPSVVEGEVTATKDSRAELASDSLRALEAVRFGPGPKLLLGRERARLHHDASESARFEALSTRVQREEIKRLVRQAMTDGRPILARNVLAALRHVAATGQLPPFAPRSSASLRTIDASRVAR